MHAELDQQVISFVTSVLEAMGLSLTIDLEETPDPRNGGKPLSENTLVIFTSDNGGEEDPVGSGAWNGPLREDKGQMYEGGIRVPWIVWSQNPDLVRGGGRANETIINSTDLYTTFASYAQAALPAGVPLDGWHTLEVKVRRPGRFRIRARAGYFG